MINSPYEFNTETRTYFVHSLEKILETKIKNNKKIKYLFQNELECKLQNGKRKISLEYYKKTFGDNDETFINVLKKAGFSKKTTENLPKYLNQHGSKYIIDLCKRKCFLANLDKLFDSNKMEYSIIYMDLLLNFFAFNFQIRPNGKNESLYYKLINQALSITKMITEYNNNSKFEFLTVTKINNIIDALNADEIEYQLNNHITIIMDEINSFVKSVPDIVEHIPDKSNNESEDIFYKKYFQVSSFTSEDILNIIKYFQYIYNILETNKLEFLIEKIDSKRKFYDYKYDTCSDECVDKYEILIKKCIKAHRKLKKAHTGSKKYKYIAEIFNELLVNYIQNNMFEFFKNLNHNFEQFINFKGKSTLNHFKQITYYDKNTEYRVNNNLIDFLSKFILIINSENVEISEFILLTVLKFLYHTEEDNKISFISKVHSYDAEQRSFTCACIIYALIKNIILRISNLKVIQPELMILFNKYKKQYYLHIAPFYSRRNTLTKKQKKILELTSHLPKNIQKQVISSDFLKLIDIGKSNKKNNGKNEMALKEWIQFLLPTFEKNITNIPIKSSISKKKVDNSELLKHLDELLSPDISIFEPVQKKINNDKKKSYKNFLDMKEERDNIQQLINELELLDENPEEFEEQLKELDCKIKKLEPKYQFYQKINQEEEAAKNCIKINTEIERYRSILTEYKENEDENIDKIEEIEKNIDNCISRLEYERIHFPVLDRRTGKIQGSNTITYLPYEEPKFSNVILNDQGYQLKKQVDTFKRETDKQDKRLQQISKFKNLLKQAEQSVLGYIIKLNKFFGLTDDDIDINYTDFSKKIVYSIFDKYWFNSKYCIKSKIEMYFRMYVRNSTKSFYQGYPQIVLDLIKIITSIQYLIILHKKIDLDKLINTKKIIINKIHKNKIFIGKTFEIISGDDTGKQGIVFTEEENNVIIKYQDTFIEELKTNIKRITVNKDFIGKLIKPIVGNYKGRICMIIGERHDKFQLTVDSYGGSSFKCHPGITYITLKKEQFHVLPDHEQLSIDHSLTREYKKIELTFKPKKIDLYNCTRCLFDLFGFSTSHFITYNENNIHDDRFNFLYGIGLVLYNKNKISDTECYYSYIQLNDKMKNLQRKSKTCSHSDKLIIRNSLMQIKKQIEKKQFIYNKRLIFKEKNAWDNTDFKTSKLNKISEFLVFENTCSSKKDTSRTKRQKVKKIKINDSKVFKKSISKMKSLFDDLIM